MPYDQSWIYCNYIYLISLYISIITSFNGIPNPCECIRRLCEIQADLLIAMIVFFFSPRFSCEHAQLSSETSALFPAFSHEVRWPSIPPKLNLVIFLLRLTASFISHLNRSHKDRLKEKCIQSERKLVIYQSQIHIQASKQGRWKDVPCLDCHMSMSPQYVPSTILRPKWFGLWSM